MNIEIIKLLIDFGLVILIWMVQLLIYPSFLYYSKAQLIQWHQRYTLRIGYIVMPLMLTQIIIVILFIINKFHLLTIVQLFLLLVVWGLTFFQFVPLHATIAKNEATPELLSALVRKNWLRTFIWTLVFVLGVLRFHIQYL